MAPNVDTLNDNEIPVSWTLAPDIPDDAGATRHSGGGGLYGLDKDLAIPCEGSSSFSEVGGG